MDEALISNDAYEEGYYDGWTTHVTLCMDGDKTRCHETSMQARFGFQFL